MAKPTIVDLTNRSQKSGMLVLGWLITPFGRYRTGHYHHRLGLVLVVADKGVCIISFFHAGQLHTDRREDFPTDGQISRFCRQLLERVIPPCEQIRSEIAG